jgi:2-methylcitrate dehydratase PrpD
MSEPAAALAAHVAAARFQDLPAATVEATKRDLLDSLACALGGSGAAGITERMAAQRLRAEAVPGQPAGILTRP